MLVCKNQDKKTDTECIVYLTLCTYPSDVKLKFLQIYKVVVPAQGLFFVGFPRGVCYTVQQHRQNTQNNSSLYNNTGNT